LAWVRSLDFVPDTVGCDGPGNLSAIECHTTGKQIMSLLEKIIYMADITSAERDYPGVEALRAEEMLNLDLGAALCLDKALLCARKSQPIDPDTVADLICQAASPIRA
jgi:Predicted HD superfamily hydrolase involved in NAD metabolism